MDKLTVGWSDGHTSEFDISWLADRRFDKDNQTIHNEDIKREQHYKTNNRLIKSIRFNDVSIVHNLLLIHEFVRAFLSWSSYSFQQFYS